MICLGCLNLSVFILPLLKNVAVFLIPSAKELLIFKTAANGEMNAPIRPVPTPYKVIY